MSAKVISIREGTCRSVQHRIDTFLEDRLPAHVVRWFLRHLLRCRNCRRQLDRRNRAKEGMEAAMYVMPPPGLIANVIARIRSESTRVTPGLTETKDPA